jgi:TRAP-type C4-dicarboxylate transport system permease small subunit
MTKVFDRLGKTLEHLIALLLGIMVVLVGLNVFLRYAFNSGISVSEEVARWAFVWMVFLGGALALKDNAHLGIDSVVKMLPPAGQKICIVVSHLLTLALVLILLVGAWKVMVLNASTTAPTTRLSVGIFYASGVVFSVLAIAFVVRDVVLGLRGVGHDQEKPHNPGQIA